ncbi:MAG: glutamate racemase [Cytophagales bacterium]
MDKNAPIGIFDSGIGGLTVAKAIKELLPNENLIYFGDTAHLPYGDKSQAMIQSYSLKICNLLMEHKCKVIVIACNSASAAAYELLKEYVGSRSHIINVVDPAVKYVKENFSDQKVGLIGTKATVRSGIYKSKIDQQKAGIELKSLATPLLVPMIEEGFFNENISEGIIEQYLRNEELEHIKALILGCTHYPLIKKQIDKFYNGNVVSIDSSKEVAKELLQVLKDNLAINDESKPFEKFYVSDYTKSFEESTKIFFGEQVKIEKYPLWS